MIARISILTIALTLQTAFAQTTPASKPDLARAKQTAETLCGACHGADGNSPAAAFPKLAGQHEAYLLKQLREYKAVGDKPPARLNELMGPTVLSLSDDDMRGLAIYFAGQKLKPEFARNAATVEAGRKLWRAGNAATGVPACASCHGPAGYGLPAQYPRLQGQYAEYLEAQIKAFRDGKRSNDPASMMRDISIRMTEAEIKAVSDFAAGLR